MTRLLALLLAAVPAAGQDSLLAVFWNLENLKLMEIFNV
jgi:hypothetical protein